MQTFVMRIQIDVAVDTVCAGVPSFVEFACLFGANYGDHFSSLPIEVVLAINGVCKHERQEIVSADGQFVFVYAGPKSSACMAYAAVMSSSLNSRSANPTHVSYLLYMVETAAFQAHGLLTDCSTGCLQSVTDLMEF
ncbi:unnamed protein product [Schistocephalus solidus]|uniref:Peptidase_M24 domain-containing protein n=1 Tax=Schistocephalus solidus TaxID=70667 RepID=A0A183TDK6_SCHSO|nr:unnamed protein product [Schistocephalus solidus]